MRTSGGRMMKSLFGLAVVVSLAVGLSGCGGAKNSTSGTNAESGTVSLTLNTQGTFANVAGAWSGTFTPSGSTTFTPGSLSLSMVQNGHLVNLNQSATNTAGTTQVQNTYGTMDG